MNFLVYSNLVSRHWLGSRSYILTCLLCNRGDNARTLVGLPLQGWGDGNCGRTRELIEAKDQDVVMLANLPTTALNIELQLRMSAQRNDIIFRHILYQEDT